MNGTVESQGSFRSRDRAFLTQMLRRIPKGDVALRMWDGNTVPAPNGSDAACTLVFRTPAALSRLLLRPNALTLGEAYVNGTIDIEGNIVHLARANSNDTPTTGFGARIGMLPSAVALFLVSSMYAMRARVAFDPRGSRISRRRVSQSIEFHYNQPTEFWRLWLDPELQYTCGYFRSSNTTLEQAQADKMEHICRKLRLQRHERLLDMGCGWGGLMRLAARKYGTQVTGVTLSQSQYDHVRAWAAAERLEEQVQIQLTDFRDLTGENIFEKVAGIGIIEHVGPELQQVYFRQAFRLLRPGGSMLNQGITRDSRYGRSAGSEFVDKYVFPGARLLTIGETIQAAEAAGFIVRDVEALSEHYLPTLQSWRNRLEKARDQIVNLVGEAVYRIFRFYLAGFEAAFEARKFGLYQCLFDKPGQFREPSTREHLYLDAYQAVSPNFAVDS